MTEPQHLALLATILLAHNVYDGTSQDHSEKAITDAVAAAARIRQLAFSVSRPQPTFRGVVQEEGDR